MIKLAKKDERNLKNKTDDVVNMSVARLAWPIFVQALLSMCLGYADTLMLSGYTQTAVAAIGNANQILGFLTLAFTVISSASGVVVAQYLGAKQNDKINRIYTVCIAFNLVLSLFISLLVFFGSDALLSLINTPAEIMSDARNYMRIVGGFIFTQAILDTFSRIFQSNGKTVFGMIISLGMNVVNIGGNYLFLYGPLSKLGFGASGVAVSTTVSRIFSLIVAFVLFSLFIDGSISIKYLKPFPFDVLKTLLRLGVPTAGETISYNISQLFVTSFVNTLGIVAINTKIYANILSNFAYLYSISVAMATTIIVGHAVGAGDYDFAYKRVNKSMRGALIVSMCIACFNFIISPFTFELFTAHAETVEIQNQIIGLGHQIMFVAIFLELGRTSNLVIINSLKASGDVKFPTFLGVVANWSCSVICGYILGIVCNFGLVGIWIALAADEIIRGIVVAVRWCRGTWRGKRVVSEDTYLVQADAAQE
jgi:putative MATE family efflux protein